MLQRGGAGGVRRWADFAGDDRRRGRHFGAVGNRDGVPGQGRAGTLAGPPNELVLVVRPDLPISTAYDLKGRSIGVTGPSLTGWLVQALSRQ